jgi:hypothetical protein
MWIIPKHPLLISACAPDTEELIWGSKELSIMCEQSLLVKSKRTPSKTWRQRLKRDTSTQRLFGLILKPSHGASFTERWTLSAEASLVSHSAPQGGEPVTTTLDTYGHTSHEELENWADLPLFSSKMWRGSSHQSSAATTGATPQERPFCCISSASWSEWITAQRQEYSARAKQAPPTSESGCSYLARAMTSAPRAALLYQDCSRTQSNQATHGPADEEPHNTHGSPHESHGQLNPRWVETLMGLPVGWTMASCSTPWIIEPTNLDYLETELYQQQQSEPLEPCGGAWGTPHLSTANARPRAGARGPNTEYRIENQVLDTWPTPQARDHKGSSGRSNLGLELDLPAAVKATTTTTPAQTQGTPNNEPST